jgi:putative ABC transport system permease protein
VIYRLILQAAYQIDMPSYMVKLLSALIVTVALVLPLLRTKIAAYRVRRAGEKESGA